MYDVAIQASEDLDACMPRPATYSSTEAFPQWSALRALFYNLPAGEVALPANPDLWISVFFSTRSVRFERHLRGEVSVVQLGLDTVSFSPAGESVYCKWDGFVEVLQMRLSHTFVCDLATKHDLHSSKLLNLANMGLRDPIVAQIAHEIARLISGNTKRVSIAYLDSLATFLVLHLAEAYGNNGIDSLGSYRSPKLKTPDLGHVAVFIQENLHKNLQLSKLAQIAKLSNFYFIKQFRATFGTSPHQYILSCRIALAKQLLTDTFLSMSHISERCGFSSQSHFTSVFRQSVGIPPSLFRHNNCQSIVKQNMH